MQPVTSAATAFASAILENKPKAVEKYLHFLASGGSDYSLNLLKTAGVDLTTPLPVTVTLHKFAEKLQELKTLTWKITKRNSACLNNRQEFLFSKINQINLVFRLNSEHIF